MKLFKMLAAILMLLITSSALAKDEVVTIDGKTITVTDAYNAFGSAEKIYHIKKGIYVSILKGLNEDVSPNAEKLAREYLVSKKFNVVNKPEDADIAIRFTISGSTQMADIEAQSSQSLVNGGKLVTNAGGLVASVVSSGLTGGVGFLAGGLWGGGNKTSIIGDILENPTTVMWKGKKIVRSSSDEEHLDMMRVEFGLAKDKATADVIFKMMLDQWTKRYLVNDAPVENIPAWASSSIPAISSVAAANVSSVSSVGAVSAVQ